MKNSSKRNNEERIYHTLINVIEKAKKQCNEETYVSCESDGRKYGWRVIHHKLPNGLHIYTILREEDFNPFSEKIDYEKQYPYTNSKNRNTVITTVMSPDELYTKNVTSLHNINLIIPSEEDKVVLISESNRNKRIKEEHIGYVLGRTIKTNITINGALISTHLQSKQVLIDKALTDNGEVSIKIDGRYLERMKINEHGVYKSAHIRGAQTITEVIDVTLDEASNSQNITKFEIMSQVRELHRMLGIREQSQSETISTDEIQEILDEAKRQANSGLESIERYEKLLEKALIELSEQKKLQRAMLERIKTMSDRIK